MKRRRALPLVVWCTLAAVAWWAIAEGRLPSGPGAVVVVATLLATVAAGLRMGSSTAWVVRPSRLPAFVAFFVAQSVGGGLDVARRALSPWGETAPAMIDFRTRLADGPPRSLFVAFVSVMPGTLVAGDLGDGLVRVHVIDGRRPAEPDLRRVEEHIEALVRRR